MISSGLIFVQKAFLVGLFSVELIFGEAYYWRELCVSKWVVLDNKNGLNTTIQLYASSGTERIKVKGK